MMMVEDMVVLAQLVSVPDCGSGGHRFDSDIPPHRLVGTDIPAEYPVPAGLLYIQG